MKPTIEQLFEFLSSCGDLLANANKSGIWPDANPEWDLDLFDMNQIQSAINFMKKPVTLDQISYNKELVLVRFTEDKINDAIDYCIKNSIELPNWLVQNENGSPKLFLVIGEIAQKPDHFIVVDTITNSIIDSAHGFHGTDLEIVLPHAPENGMTIFMASNNQDVTNEC